MRHARVARGLWAAALLVDPSGAQAASPPSARGAAVHLERLEQLDRHLLEVERQLAVLDDARDEARRAQSRARAAEAQQGLLLEDAEARLRLRLGAWCRRRAAGHAIWRQGARRLSAYVDRERTERVLAEHDRGLWRRVQQARSQLRQSAVERARALRVWAEASRKQARVREALGRERRRRQDALAQLARQGGRRQALLAARAAGESALGGLVNGRSVALEGRWPSEPALQAGEMSAVAQGTLAWPAVGRVRARFGERVDLAFGTVTRQHGIDIAAPAGSRVRAVARGQVVFAGWLSGFGQTVIVAHPHEVHSVHAHLAHLQVHVGQGVEAEQPLGFVGATGSLRGSLLHFELRRRGQPEDPLAWLVAAPSGVRG